MENKSSRRLHDRRILDRGSCGGVTNKLVFFQFYNKMVDYLKKALIYGYTSRISS